MTVCLPLFRVNNYNLAVQGWDLDEGVEHGPAEVGGRDDLNRCNNALNQMVVDLDSSVLDRDPAAAAVLRAPTSNDAGLNKPGLVLTGNGKKKTQPSFKIIYIIHIFFERLMVHFHQRQVNIDDVAKLTMQGLRLG